MLLMPKPSFMGENNSIGIAVIVLRIIGVGESGLQPKQWVQIFSQVYLAGNVLHKGVGHSFIARTRLLSEVIF